MTWDDLADLRRCGLRPELPVYVTDRWQLTQNMVSVGCVAILHRSGQSMPVELLAGLDLRLDFDRCERAGQVKRLMDRRGVAAGSLLAWCSCWGGFVAVCGPCDSGGEPWSG
jgi:hypothetical protein